MKVKKKGMHFIGGGGGIVFGKVHQEDARLAKFGARKMLALFKGMRGRKSCW